MQKTFVCFLSLSHFNQTNDPIVPFPKDNLNTTFCSIIPKTTPSFSKNKNKNLFVLFVFVFSHRKKTPKTSALPSKRLPVCLSAGGRRDFGLGLGQWEGSGWQLDLVGWRGLFFFFWGPLVVSVLFFYFYCFFLFFWAPSVRFFGKRKKGWLNE